MRNLLLKEIADDSGLSMAVEVTNTRRSLDWDGYINNMLRYRTVLNPVGILRGLNTRAYEAMYSGRVLLQHAVGQYRRQEEMLRDNGAVIFFRDATGLREASSIVSGIVGEPDSSYTRHSLYSRMKSIGVDIK